MSDKSIIVPCPCGVRIRLPENAKQRILRCPQCKRGLPLSADSMLLPSSPWTAPETRTICPICQTPIGANEEVVMCPGCKRVHHTECWAEVGGCGMYGCKHAFQAEKTNDPDAMAQSQNAVWEDQKIPCPVCREIISQTAAVCPLCKVPVRFHAGKMVANFSNTSPNQNLQTGTIVLFILSFIPCLAPIIAIISGMLFWGKRQKLARAGQIYWVLTLLSFIISAIFCMLMFIFLIFGILGR